MKLKEMNKKRSEILEEMNQLIDSAIVEQRNLTVEEEAKVEELQTQINEIDADLKECRELRHENTIAKEIKEEKNMENKTLELREQFMDAVSTPNKDLSKLEFRAAGDGYHAGLGDSPYNETTKGQANVPLTIEAGIRQAIDHNSNLLPHANVIQTSGTHRIVLDAAPASEARLVKEGASISTVDSEFVKVELGAYKLAEIVKITREVAEDVNFNIVAHAANRLGVAFAKAVEHYIVSGTGASQPEGVLNALTGADNNDLQKASKQVTANKDTIAANDVVAAYYNLPHECRANAVFVCHPDTVKQLALLQDSQGRQLLTDGLTPGLRTIMGCPVVETPYVDKMGTASKGVGFFADMSRALTVGIRSDITTRQLHELYAASDIVALVSTLRFDSKVVQPGAISFIVTGAGE